MTDSAILGGRELRRAETARRIHRRAQDLALEHGIDGFSMDDLAAAAEVSRRTLFNYFPGKDAAVLGDTPEYAADLVAAFVAGGPSGNLVDDVVVLVDSFLRGDGLQRDDVARLHELLAHEPRLFRLVRERFEQRADQLIGFIQLREGASYDADRTRILVHVMAALFEFSMTAYLQHRDRDLGEIYAEAVQLARSTFA